MDITQLINHLRVIIRLHEINEDKENFVYWQLKVLLEEFE